ncbi:MAG TPA: hypothetical protein PLE99_11235 [Candidatus Thiothrix moscowensis]|uniref:hypothetical protein n=1 Tax=unclassified Thiothrix TaxID=2636184 RepID=UPI0025D1CE4F|nr:MULTISPECIES: hypothetical protein [unclassified Thiothrix]HRJ53333.1 hypothetical protein [Candidatus Thiothrix moscowensis]HRJ94172.1 hypothetical protein [Candidatus Thiothrix moscowensis]
MDSVKHNYTEERQQWLGNPTLEEIRADILKLKQDPSNPLNQQEPHFLLRAERGGGKTERGLELLRKAMVTRG